MMMVTDGMSLGRGILCDLRAAADCSCLTPEQFARLTLQSSTQQWCRYFVMDHIDAVTSAD